MVRKALQPVRSLCQEDCFGIDYFPCSSCSLYWPFFSRLRRRYRVFNQVLMPIRPKSENVQRRQWDSALQERPNSRCESEQTTFDVAALDVDTASHRREFYKHDASCKIKRSMQVSRFQYLARNLVLGGTQQVLLVCLALLQYSMFKRCRHESSAGRG